MKIKKELIALIFINIVFIILAAKLMNEKNYYKSMLPFIAPGETINDTIFMDINTNKLKMENFNEKPIILFVFERPCSTCTGNILLWKKLYEFSKGAAHILGVIQDLPELFEIAESSNLPFKLIAPENYEEFKTKWRVHLNLAQTYLIYNNKVRLARIGNISPGDVNLFYSSLKNLEEK